MRALCAVVAVCFGMPVVAALLPNLSSGTSQQAQEAADLADAHSDSPVLRALSAMPVKTSADKAAASDPRTDATQNAVPKPVNAASAGKADPRAPGEPPQSALKDLAVKSGAMDAKQFLAAEFGSGEASDANAESHEHRRRASGDASADTPANAPLRSSPQTELDEEQATFLASALVREVTPWAIGAAALLFCAQGLRVMLAFGRRKAERKRKYRKSSGRRKARL